METSCPIAGGHRPPGNRLDKRQGLRAIGTLFGGRWRRACMPAHEGCDGGYNLHEQQMPDQGPSSLLCKSTSPCIWKRSQEDGSVVNHLSLSIVRNEIRMLC